MFICSDFIGEPRLSRKFKGWLLMKGQGNRKLKGTIFFSTKFLGELFLQIIVEFGGINVRNTTFENTREVDTKPPKILVECNGYPEMFSLSGVVFTYPNRYFRENSRWVPLRVGK